MFIRPDPVEAWSSNDGAVVVFAGPGDDKGDAVTVDSSGNVYTIGHFGDPVDFDPGPGTANLSTYLGNGRDTYILKLDSSGNYVWVKSFERTGVSSGHVDTGFDVTVDSSGNVYTIGYLSLIHI